MLDSFYSKISNLKTSAITDLSRTPQFFISKSIALFQKHQLHANDKLMASAKYNISNSHQFQFQLNSNK